MKIKSLWNYRVSMMMIMTIVCYDDDNPGEELVLVALELKDSYHYVADSFLLLPRVDSC